MKPIKDWGILLLTAACGFRIDPHVWYSRSAARRHHDPTLSLDCRAKSEMQGPWKESMAWRAMRSHGKRYSGDGKGCQCCRDDDRTSAGHNRGLMIEGGRCSDKTGQDLGPQPRAYAPYIRRGRYMDRKTRVGVRRRRAKKTSREAREEGGFHREWLSYHTHLLFFVAIECLILKEAPATTVCSSVIDDV